MPPTRTQTLTDVPGIRVGHAQVPGGGSGCTVVLGPFSAAVEVTGGAGGTRELTPLDPSHLVSQAQAILLTGGSAFGLSAADGVMTWLAERGEGFPTREGPVPIVPAAVLYDLAPGRGRPGAGEGRAACEAAGTEPVTMGRVGAGTGATVGKLLGPDRASPGGIGSASQAVGPWTVGALAAVNALGEVRDRTGAIVAGVRSEDGYLDGEAAFVERSVSEGAGGIGFGENTTLAVVATDAPLRRDDLTRWLRVAATALPRRISPAHTPFDGDVVFGVATGRPAEAPLSRAELLALGIAAREALESAILRGVSP
jgi:L-aminopeptidase/D-esterase-like protein